MLKRMSVLFCGLAVVLMTAGVANAQTATEKTKTAAKKTGEAVEKGAKKTAEVVTDAEITTAVKTKFLADSKVSGRQARRHADGACQQRRRKGGGDPPRQDHQGRSQGDQ